MARFSKGQKVQENTEETIEATEAEAALVEPEFPADDEQSDFDSFLNSGELEIPSQAIADDNSADDNSQDTQEEAGETEMAKSQVQETAEVEETTAEELTPQPIDESEVKLTEEAKRVMKEATPKAVEMKEITSIPPMLAHISSNLIGVQALGKVIQEKVEAFRAGAGDKDAKVKYAVEHLTPEEDETHTAILEARANGTAEEGARSNFERREFLAQLKKQIEELSEQFDTEEAALYESVEAALTAKGEEIWSDEKIDEEKNFIGDMYKNYVSMYNNTSDLMKGHNKVKASDNLGTIDQYVNKIDKPFGSKGKSDNSSTGGSKNVFVSLAEMSTDGTNWIKVENSKGQSNVAVLAAEIARLSKESQADLRDKIYNDYYVSADKTFETATNENMPAVATFKVNYQVKGSGEFADVHVRLTKRFQD